MAHKPGVGAYSAYACSSDDKTEEQLAGERVLIVQIFRSKKRVWRAVRKGTVMAFANASIIMVVATIADVWRSVWTAVVIVAASALAYFAAYHEARFDDEQDAAEAARLAHESDEAAADEEAAGTRQGAI